MLLQIMYAKYEHVVKQFIIKILRLNIRNYKKELYSYIDR